MDNTFADITGWPYQLKQGGGGEETRFGTEKRCSHNFQSDHLA